MKAAYLAALLCAGCVSIADVDMTKAERVCAQQCSQNYSYCVAPSGAVVPRAINNYQCKQALEACIRSCPPR